MATPSADHVESQRSQTRMSISLRATLTLLYYLLCLHILHGISLILQPFKSKDADSFPLEEPIKCKEAQVLTVITEIAPHRIYRSPVPSSVFTYEYMTAHRVTAGHVPPPHAGFDGHYDSGSIPTRITRPSVAYHNTSTRSSVPGFLITPESPIRFNTRGIEPARSPLRSDTFVPYEVAGPNVKFNSWKSQHVLFADPVVNERQSRQEANDSRALDPATYHLRHVHSPTQLRLMSVASSAEDLADTFNVKPRVSSNTSDESLALSLVPRRPMMARSAESFPGQFPVSEGLKPGSLATDPSAFRERETMHVRPFSDY
ncbi:Uncharacterized protein PECH_005351 [Penicillium ucsense]|uniref:Uncharacterized protein n=1 Tax=Penicillium ucsense TaxID=2839758 RepID=A0A8J8W720_9EURO|nr:Uncharacterized protein PECM_004081 [Penicillium ucsense]KAF7736378.1 Uncharacterized protein PECH_005351 [Penicillium ucsense]